MLGARRAGLDFIATTEHNSAAAHGAWGALAREDFLIVIGEEVTTKSGHWLALGIRPGQLVDWNYRVSDGLIDRCLDQVHAVGGVCVAAHPHAPYPSGEFLYSYQAFDAVEVWNGLWRSDRPWNADNEAALAEWGRSLAAGIRAGTSRPAIGSSDTHLDGQIGIPHTVVLAEELSSQGILAGIRAGRSWIAESAAVELSFTAASADHLAGVGECLATSSQPAGIRVRVTGVPSGVVSFHTDRGQVHCASLPGHGAGVAQWQTTSKDSAFVRVEVRHPQGDVAALTNPIILS